MIFMGFAEHSLRNGVSRRVFVFTRFDKLLNLIRYRNRSKSDKVFGDKHVYRLRRFSFIRIFLVLRSKHVSNVKANVHGVRTRFGLK